MPDPTALADAAVVVVVVLAATVVAAWLLRDLRTVPDRVPPREGRGPLVSVVVPARDEERTLPALLDSVRRLPGEALEVVVVDDDSRDATATVARAGGATVLPAGDRPPGWTGKAWACHVGARATRGELLLFLDADTVLAPGAVDGLVELHARHGGLVSVQPFHTAVRAHEQLSAYFNVVALMASGAFTRRPARRPAPWSARRPMAFGPCLLTSRSDYERAGGHAAVRAAILDDVDLARAYADVGLPVTCAVGGRSVRMRSYPDDLQQLADGWTKNIASGASASAPGPTVGTVLWVSAHHAVAVGAAGALLALLSDLTGPRSGQVALWALAWVAVAAQLRWALRQAGSFRWWAWALFPVPLLAFDLLFARSAVLTLVRRSVRWRGREVDLRRAPAGGGR